jgi:hypothetical protein
VVEAIHGAAPTMVHAAVYSAVRHYLESVRAAGTDEAQAVMKKMRELPVNDMYVQGGILRQDGRLLHPMYLVEVKKPSESKGDWDCYKVLGSIPGDQAFMDAKESLTALERPLLCMGADIRKPSDGGAAHTGAGVLKPPKEETAGGPGKVVSQKLWGFGRWRGVAEVR